MNEQEKEEILKALQLIKDICISHECVDCPFGGVQNKCNICSRLPNVWDIKQLERPKEWHAFN